MNCKRSYRHETLRKSILHLLPRRSLRQPQQQSRRSRQWKGLRHQSICHFLLRWGRSKSFCHLYKMSHPYTNHTNFRIHIYLLCYTSHRSRLDSLMYSHRNSIPPHKRIEPRNRTIVHRMMTILMKAPMTSPIGRSSIGYTSHTIHFFGKNSNPSMCCRRPWLSPEDQHWSH